MRGIQVRMLLLAAAVSPLLPVEDRSGWKRPPTESSPLERLGRNRMMQKKRFTFTGGAARCTDDAHGCS